MIKQKTSLLWLLMLAVLCACGGPKEKRVQPLPFDASFSDPAAVQLVDSVVKASGGELAWNEIKFISWSSSLGRNIFWNKTDGKVRIEIPGEHTIYLLNLNDTTVRVKTNDQESQRKEDALQALDMFDQEAFNLALPFLLKRNGNKLTYLGEDTLANGVIANVVSVTKLAATTAPNQGYTIQVDRSDNKIKTVSYYTVGVDSSATGDVWDNYQKFGGVMLSTERSSQTGPKRVKVDKLPEDLFEKF